MSETIPSNEITKKIHNQIINVCEHLHTSYESKKHGGYNIYLDNKIHASTDTYVPNVWLSIILPDGKNEMAFSCSYSGDFVTYHAGKWEEYLEKLYVKALAIKAEKNMEYQKKQKEEEEKAKAPVSKEADSVFG